MKKTLICAALLAISCSLMFGQQYNYKVLYSFGAQAGDGAFPIGALLRDDKGNFYGATVSGGVNSGGTVFELSNVNGKWTETVLYSFCSVSKCADGQRPLGGLVFDAAGNLYGATEFGGSGSPDNGTVFKLSPPIQGEAWTETVLYNFCSVGTICQDGSMPLANVIIDAAGNLYGATSAGGANNGVSIGASGLVYELTQNSGVWTENILYTFCAAPSMQGFCPDGSSSAAGLTFDTSGNLYGTTQLGGSTDSIGGGTVFKLSNGASGWTETVLHAFPSSQKYGYDPMGGVTFDIRGNIYSTAGGGGTRGAGVVFRLSPSGNVSEFSFNVTDGNSPEGGVLLDPHSHFLYGTTSVGGSTGNGVVYSISPQGQETVVYSFCTPFGCSEGGNPNGPLVETNAGDLLGVTFFGGNNNKGVIYALTPAH